jgi:hypothetical protein
VGFYANDASKNDAYPCDLQTLRPKIKKLRFLFFRVILKFFKQIFSAKQGQKFTQQISKNTSGFFILDQVSQKLRK